MKNYVDMRGQQGGLYAATSWLGPVAGIIQKRQGVGRRDHDHGGEGRVGVRRPLDHTCAYMANIIPARGPKQASVGLRFLRFF